MKLDKLIATLNCIKDSETILGGEYYVIHSDYVIALEEEINKLNININMEVKIDGKKIKEILDKADKGE